MDRIWNPEVKEAELKAEAPEKLTVKTKRDPKSNVVNTAGSSDYVRLRGLREQGYYVLYED